MRATAPMIVALLLALAGCLQAPEESVEDTSDSVTPEESADTEEADTEVQEDAPPVEDPEPTVTPDETPSDESDFAGEPGEAEDEPTNVPPGSGPADDEPAVSEDEDAAPVVVVNDSEDGGAQDANDPGPMDREQEADDASRDAEDPEAAGEAEDEPRTAGDAGPPANEADEEAPAPEEDEDVEPQEDEASEPWPREGSYARYHVDQGGGSPGGYPQQTWDVDVLLTYRNGSWTARCEGTLEHRESNGTWTEPVNESADLTPPRADTDVSEGDNLTVPGFNARCDPTTHPVTVLDANASYETNRSGEPVNVSAFHGYREPRCGCMGDEAYWEQEEGLVLEWWFGGTGGGWRGILLDTDAPIG